MATINYKDSSGTSKKITPINILQCTLEDKLSSTSENGLKNKAIYQALEDYKKEILLLAHPVGSYYWSDNSTDPSLLFGGTWERVTDKFILAAGSTYTAGSTGGEATHILTTSEMPSHTHTFSGTSTTTTTGGAHVHHGLNVDGSLVSVINGQSGSGYGFGSASGLYNQGNGISINTKDSSHSHTFTAKGTNSNTGSGAAHNNMPPYKVAYCWVRVSETATVDPKEKAKLIANNWLDEYNTAYSLSSNYIYSQSDIIVGGDSNDGTETDEYYRWNVLNLDGSKFTPDKSAESGLIVEDGTYAYIYINKSTLEVESNLTDLDKALMLVQESYGNDSSVTFVYDHKEGDNYIISLPSPTESLYFRVNVINKTVDVV